MSDPGPLLLASPAGRMVVTAAVLGSGMTMLDGSVVNVALRTIGEDLDASLADLQWITNGYLLSLASLILLGGALGDRFGRRRIFVIGTIWFALASLLCGLATTPLVLIVARVLQGVGGALLTPGSLSIIQSVFRTEDRGRAIGAWSGLGGIAAAIGPFVGGALAAAPDENAGIASGVNNAVARAGSLLAVAALPVAVGLSGEQYAVASAFDRAYDRAAVACAVLLALGGVLSWLTIRTPEQLVPLVDA